MPNWVVNHLTITGENAVEVLRSLLKERTEENESGSLYDLDFNKLIPMPESLRIDKGTTTNNCVEMYLTSINPFIDYFGEDKVDPNVFLGICQAVQATNSFRHYNYCLSFEEVSIREKETYVRDEQSNQKTLIVEEILEIGQKAVNNVLTYGAMDWYDWSIDNWGTKWNACRTQIPDLNTAEVYFDTAWSPVPQIMLALTAKYPKCTFDYEYAEEETGYLAGHSVYKAGHTAINEIFESYSKEAYEMYFKLWGQEDDYIFNSKTGTYEHKENEEEM